MEVSECAGGMACLAQKYLLSSCLVKWRPASFERYDVADGVDFVMRNVTVA